MLNDLYKLHADLCQMSLWIIAKMDKHDGASEQFIRYYNCMVAVNEAARATYNEVQAEIARGPRQ